ncbi:sugar phosphate isomerase/epimerase family protein [Paenibacillus dakarensis]|uniref:sugar phosphate isomerase/epimerase family protein n=1 Tax=Paenibacillus dakarensis TaxID=1527293 RepID=UPI0006D5AD97|nr:sugar phosphate isomerase/epimerase family protein [Paenibacillus dakarensis]
MTIFINLLPYMRDEEQLDQFLKRWKGGIEVVTEGYDWSNNATDWNKQNPKFQAFSGPISVHTPIFDLNLAAPRYSVLTEYSYEIYEQALQWSARLGAKHAVIHPNLQSTPIYHREETQQCSKNYLRKLGEMGEALGVKVVVENVGFHECALYDEDEFVELFNEIPSIDALLDVGHAHINGWDIPRMIERLGERLTVVHLHDNNGLYDEHVPIGEGTIEWDGIWRALERAQHKIDLILEYNIGTSTELLLEHAEALEHNMGKLGSPV